MQGGLELFDLVVKDLSLREEFKSYFLLVLNYEKESTEYVLTSEEKNYWA